MCDELIGLIPAAGKGLRLGLPYPKELYPIIRENRYKPVAQYVVENLVASGVEQIVFVINETKHQLIGYFGDGHRFGCRLSYVVQEPRESDNGSTSPGLADALDAAYHLVRGKTVCFGMADTLMTPKDLFRRTLLAARPGDDVIQPTDDAIQQTDDVLLGLFPTGRPEKFGMVQMDGAGRVECIQDKPAHTSLIYMWGFIIWRSAFTEHLHRCLVDQRVSDFAHVMNLAIGRGLRFRGVVFQEGTYADLGTYDEIQELERLHRAA